MKEKRGKSNFQEEPEYFSLLDCMEIEFQKKERCLLPWYNIFFISGINEKCQSLDNFNNFRKAFDSLKNYGPMDL